MLRDYRGLNKAASPVKFPEYLACNLKVVASPGIGDVSDCIIKNDCGILIDTFSALHKRVIVSLEQPVTDKSAVNNSR